MALKAVTQVRLAASTDNAAGLGVSPSPTGQQPGKCLLLLQDKDAIRLGLLLYFAVLEFRASSLHSLTHFLSISSLALFLWSTLVLPCFCCNSVFFVSPSASLSVSGLLVSCLIFSLSSSLLVYLCCLPCSLSLPASARISYCLSPSLFFFLAHQLSASTVSLAHSYVSFSLSLFVLEMFSHSALTISDHPYSNI